MILPCSSSIADLLFTDSKEQSLIKLRTGQMMRYRLTNFRYFSDNEVWITLNSFANSHTVCLEFSAMTAHRILVLTELNCPNHQEKYFLDENGQNIVGISGQLKLHFRRQNEYLFRFPLQKSLLWDHTVFNMGLI